MIVYTKKLISCLLFGLLFIQCANKVEKGEQKPNILFILIDDQRNDILSCAGHQIVKTPTVDKLAEKGIRFTNAFVTTSICAASRATIFTGLYESKHNYTFGMSPLKKEYIRTSYPYLVKQAGYNTGFVGKLGIQMEEQDSLLKEMFDFLRLSPKNSPYVIELPDGSKLHSAEIWGNEAVNFIRNQTADKPFCLSISFNSVHAVDDNISPGNDGHYPYPEAVADMYENIIIPKPKLSDIKIFENHPEFLKKSLNRERYFWRWDTEEKYQINMKAYYRMISGYDNVIENIIAVLKEKGFDRNTVVIFSADNGYYMGNRGFAGKWTHYDESLRVPMIIYDPRNSNGDNGKTSDKMTLNIDIPATILDLAGISIPQTYQGKSLLPFIKNDNIEMWREDFLCEHRMDHVQIPKYVGIRGERYVYVNYYEQNPQYEYLHDLDKDPDQLVNFVDVPEYKDILQMMRSKCKNYEKELQ